jgi:hypothetical protein
MAKHTEWTPALEAELAAPFPRELVQQKEMKSKKTGHVSRIDFVAWHHYTLRLNDLVGSGWSMGEPILREVAGKLVMALPVTVLGVTRVNVGDEDEDKDDYGTASTNAWAQAFKRTCALFGMGLDMYDKKGLAEKAARANGNGPVEAMAQAVKDAAPRTVPYEPEPRRSMLDELAHQERKDVRDGSAPPTCPQCGSDMWDNREGKKNPRSPDFKCKDKVCGHAIWKDSRKKAATTAPLAAGPDEPPPGLWGDQ